MATPAVPVPLNPNPVTPDDRLIATPGNTFYASAGGYTAASGVVSASAYMLEEYQDLTIEYKRMPKGSVNEYYGVELNLSSASASATSQYIEMPLKFEKLPQVLKTVDTAGGGATAKKLTSYLFYSIT